MQAKSLLAFAFATAATLAAAAPALAGENTYDHLTPSTSTLTRAQVLAEAAQARAAGLIAHGESPVFAPATGTPKTRAQVVAETLEAIRIGAIDRGEQTRFITPAQAQQIEMAGLRALQMDMAVR